MPLYTEELFVPVLRVNSNENKVLCQTNRKENLKEFFFSFFFSSKSIRRTFVRKTCMSDDIQMFMMTQIEE